MTITINCSLLMYGFVGWGGSANKVDDVTALPSHIQDGGYALLWQRYDNNKMAAICYYGNVILHLQQYSRRLNFFIYFVSLSTAVRPV